MRSRPQWPRRRLPEVVLGALSWALGFRPACSGCAPYRPIAQAPLAQARVALRAGGSGLPRHRALPRGAARARRSGRQPTATCSGPGRRPAQLGTTTRDLAWPGMAQLSMASLNPGCVRPTLSVRLSPASSVRPAQLGLASPASSARPAQPDQLNPAWPARPAQPSLASPARSGQFVTARFGPASIVRPGCRSLRQHPSSFTRHRAAEPIAWPATVRPNPWRLPIAPHPVRTWPSDSSQSRRVRPATGAAWASSSTSMPPPVRLRRPGSGRTPAILAGLPGGLVLR